ncbi:MAG: DivIVA domain-containing protein [Ilumatobacter sp.]|jgi:DivIVA domain-containing protein
MAMSVSRPDPSSPASIADASFGTSRRGFDQAEVKDFLRMVAAELGRMGERERFLERELNEARNDPAAAAPVDDEAMTRLLGEEAMRVLITARESASEIRQKAEQSAAQMLSEAGDEANRVREEADIEASRRRGDAAADAEAELSMAKQQGREMVNEARAYRERVLSELARRRELAREQIEQLIHGRDRLMQAFERARLVAVDVVAEMQPLGEPDEYVNLTPTTGPLPVMIANSARPHEAAAALVVAQEAVEPEADNEAVAVISSDSGLLRVVDDIVEPVGVAEAEVADEAAPASDSDTEVDEDVVEPAAEDAVEEVDAVEDADAAAENAVEDAVAGVNAVEESDAVEEVAAVEEVVAVEEVDAETDDIAEVAEPVQSEVDDDEDHSDVVVDLFARIRADVPVAAPAEAKSPADETTIDVVEVAEVTEVTEVDVEIVDVESEIDAAIDAAVVAFAERDEVVTPLIVSSAKKLKRALADEQNDVLDALRRGEPVHELDEMIPTASEHVARYTAAIADDLEAAVQFGGATSRIGTPKLRKGIVLESVNAANDAVEQWLVLPLRDRLARCIAEGAGDNSVVTKKVRSVYREWKTQHIDESLDDVLRRAHGRGVLAGFASDTPIVWEADPRFPACPDCEDNVLAGAIAAGDEFPTGDVFAPAHQGCRCLLAAADR